jgi:hypothetical protein
MRKYIHLEINQTKTIVLSISTYIIAIDVNVFNVSTEQVNKKKTGVYIYVTGKKKLTEFTLDLLLSFFLTDILAEFTIAHMEYTFRIYPVWDD